MAKVCSWTHDNTETKSNQEIKLDRGQSNIYNIHSRDFEGFFLNFHVKQTLLRDMQKTKTDWRNFFLKLSCSYQQQLHGLRLSDTRWGRREMPE